MFHSHAMHVFFNGWRMAGAYAHGMHGVQMLAQKKNFTFAFHAHKQWRSKFQVPSSKFQVPVNEAT